MTYTAVAVFADRAAADRASAELAATINASDGPGTAGDPRESVTVHGHAAAAANTGAVEADEYLTGGLVAQFGHLLDGLLDSSPPEGNAATYRDLLATKGTLVSLRTESASVAKDAAERLRAAGAQRVAVLPQPGLESD